MLSRNAALSGLIKIANKDGESRRPCLGEVIPFDYCGPMSSLQCFYPVDEHLSKTKLTEGAKYKVC